NLRVITRTDQVVLLGCEKRMFARFAIQPKPYDDPQKTRGSRGNKGRSPSVVQGQVRDGERSQQSADVRSTIEESRGECPLALREPCRHGLDGCGKIR